MPKHKIPRNRKVSGVFLMQIRKSRLIFMRLSGETFLSTEDEDRVLNKKTA